MLYKVCLYFCIFFVVLEAQTFTGCSDEEILTLSNAEENLTQKLNDTLQVLEEASTPITAYRYFREFGAQVSKSSNTSSVR